MSNEIQEPTESVNANKRNEAEDSEGPCLSCGSPQARDWQTPDGPARLCPPCATLNGIGCP